MAPGCTEVQAGPAPSSGEVAAVLRLQHCKFGVCGSPGQSRAPSVSPGSPARSTYQLEEVPRMPGAFSGSWMRRPEWRAPATAWCWSACVRPLRRELELQVREPVGTGGSARALDASVSQESLTDRRHCRCPGVDARARMGLHPSVCVHSHMQQAHQQLPWAGHCSNGREPA